MKKRTIGDVTITGSSITVKGLDLGHASLSKVLPTNEKCCEKCAFRAGSEERSDPYKWGDLCEAFVAGGAFLCHQGVPGHRHQVPGAELSLCAGRAAVEGVSLTKLIGLAHFDREARDE